MALRLRPLSGLLLLACVYGAAAIDYCGHLTYCPNGYFCCMDGMCCNTLYFSLGILFLVVVVIGITCCCYFCWRKRKPQVIMVQGPPAPGSYPGMVPPGTTIGNYPGMVIAPPAPPGSFPATATGPTVPPGTVAGGFQGTGTWQAVPGTQAAAAGTNN